LVASLNSIRAGDAWQSLPDERNCRDNGKFFYSSARIISKRFRNLATLLQMSDGEAVSTGAIRRIQS
jgi:hypothetical protein